MTFKSPQGFTLFYALLIAGLAISIGVSIFDLTERELELSAASTQSQYAIYAADTGSECALYWDNQYKDSGGKPLNGGTFSAFATSTDSTYATSGLDCTGTDITTSSVWSVSQSAGTGYATTTFSLALPATQSSSPCVSVTVVKGGNPAATTITSNGFNTCSPSALQLERTLQVSY